MGDETRTKDFYVRPGGQVTKKPHFHSRGDWRSRYDEPIIDMEARQKKWKERLEADLKEKPIEEESLESNQPSVKSKSSSKCYASARDERTAEKIPLTRAEVEEAERRAKKARQIIDRVKAVKHFGSDRKYGSVTRRGR